MKIEPSPLPVSPDSRPTHRGGDGRSFAELLESGAQADDLLSRRALGFGEAGLLGVHYAHALGIPAVKAATQDQAMASGSAGPLASALPAEFSDPGAAQSPGPVVAGRGALPQVKRPTPAAPDPVRRPAAPALGLSQSAAPGAAAVESSGSERLGSSRPPAPSSLRSCPPAPPTGRRSPLQVTLLGEASQLSLLIEGLSLEEESILELEANAHALASEYDMQISYVVVKPKRSGAGS